MGSATDAIAVRTIAALDRCFGRFMDDLKARKLYDDSIIVLTSDHGDAYGEEGRWGHAFYVAPETLRIPLILHVPETLRRTTLSRLREGAEVNVEPAVRAGEPLGGHYVQGHVDAVGRIQSVEAEGEGLRVVVEAPPEVLRLCVEKGSIAVEGVSLTVAELYDDAFAFALVPHTLEATTLSQLAPGREVNLEADVLAKYVERLVTR